MEHRKSREGGEMWKSEAPGTGRHQEDSKDPRESLLSTSLKGDMPGACLWG